MEYQPNNTNIRCHDKCVPRYHHHHHLGNDIHSLTYVEIYYIMDYILKDWHSSTRRSLLKIKWLLETLEWYCLQELYKEQILEKGLKDKFRLANDILTLSRSQNCEDVQYLKNNEFLVCGVRVKRGRREMLGGCVEEVLKNKNKDHKIYVVAFPGGDEDMINKKTIEIFFTEIGVRLWDRHLWKLLFQRMYLLEFCKKTFTQTNDVF